MNTTMNTTMNYQNPQLSSSERAADLLSRMSLEEKIAQMQCAMGEHNLSEKFPHGVGEISMLMDGSTKEEIAETIRNLQEQNMKQTSWKIPALFHIEALTGGVFPGATSYPSAIAQASTWNIELIEKMAVTIQKQMNAVGIRQALSPNMDISRDPRWGRQGETYGEDPTLAAAMSVAFVKGLQSEGTVAATAKHFLGYAFSEGGMNAAPCNVTSRKLREIYGRPFQAAITDAGLKSIMNSYGTIDGKPVITSKEILHDMLRDEMGFNGVTVSDYTATMHPLTRFRMTWRMEECASLAINAGMNNEMPMPIAYTEDNIKKMLEEGTLSEDTINEAVAYILKVKFELGLFEQPWPQEEKFSIVFNQEKDAQDSLQMAQESFILLKNNGILPIKNTRKILVIGPHADSCRALFGCYSYGALLEMILGMSSGMVGVEVDKKQSDDLAEKLTEAVVNKNLQTFPGTKVAKELPLLDDVLKGAFPGISSLYTKLVEKHPEIEFELCHGYDIVGTDRTDFANALHKAAQADLVIVTVGGKYGWGTPCTSGEGADAASINLPGIQEEFMEKLAEIEKPYIALHFDARPVSSNELDKSAAAILEVWNPGEKGAEAIENVLFGSVNPSGKLPVTVARQSGQIPIYYGHEPGTSYGNQPGEETVGYMDETALPRYAFGFGLSYTSFELSDLEIITPEVNPEDELCVRVKVKNTGIMTGDEIVQIYVQDDVCSRVRPVRELAGFKRVSLKPNESKRITFFCKISQFAFLDDNMKWKIEAGKMTVEAGNASNHLPLKDSFTILSDAFIDGKKRGFFARTEEKLF